MGRELGGGARCTSGSSGIAAAGCRTLSVWFCDSLQNSVCEQSGGLGWQKRPHRSQVSRSLSLMLSGSLNLEIKGKGENEARF